MHISQLLILSPRGDKLVFKDYREDIAHDTYETFFRQYNYWDAQLSQAPCGDCPPFFVVNGVQYAYVKRRHLFFVCTTRCNASPSTLAEFLLRVVQLLKDYLGVVSEEGVRKNFTLVYELLDEVADFGIIEETETDLLRPLINSEVVPVLPSERLLERLSRAELGDKTKRGDEAAVSVLAVNFAEKNEIYVDLLERLSITFNARGEMLKTLVEGALVLKSFLAGTPTVVVGLSNEIVLRSEHGVGRASPLSRGGDIVLEGMSFHSGVDTSQFSRTREVSLRPGVGEVTVLRYRCLHPGVAPPFRLSQSLEVPSACRGVLTIRIRAEFPAEVTALAVRVCVPLPMTTVSAAVDVRTEGASHSSEWREAERELCWVVPKFSGSIEHQAHLRFTTTNALTPAMRRAVGPVSVYFEVPQFNMTRMRVTSLSIDERGTAANPSKWIRCITQANAYTFRTH